MPVKYVRSDILLKKDVVLRTHSQRHANAVHVRADVLAVDGGRPRGGREHSSQDWPGTKRRCRLSHVQHSAYMPAESLSDIHGGGLPGSVVPEKGRNLALVEVDAESIDGWRGAVAEYLDQVLDADPLHQICRLCLEEWLLCGHQKQLCFATIWSETLNVSEFKLC